MRRRTKWSIAIGVILVAVVGLRLALPSIVTQWANSRLANIGEYSGHVDDVDLALIRGAYVLRGLRIVKPAAHSETPFFHADRIDVSVQWKALLDARLVGELEMHRPVLNLVQGSREATSQLGTGVNWPAKVRELFPFKFNRVTVIDGLVTFRAPGIATEQSLTMRDVQMTVLNLANVYEDDREAFADITFAGRVMGNAPVVLNGRVDPNSESPTFDIDMSLEHAHLVDVNPWLRRFLNVDAEKGFFSMYAELAAEGGRFHGYVKPMLLDADLFDIAEPADNPLQKIWEALVDFASNLFENREEKQVATEIPLSGNVERPDADVLTTIVNLLRNAFVGAFTRSIEDTVTLHDRKTASAD